MEPSHATVLHQDSLLESARVSTFACPASVVCSLTDLRALSYLSAFLKEIQGRQPRPKDSLSLPKTSPLLPPNIVLPLKTRPDGNCMVNAVSVAIWGTDLFSAFLRVKMTEELEGNKSWYVERLEKAHSGCGEKEFKEAVEKANVRDIYSEFIVLNSSLLKHMISLLQTSNFPRLIMLFSRISIL